jgi:hypothetical protein
MAAWSRSRVGIFHDGTVVELTQFQRTDAKKLLINSSETVSTNILVLRQAQHEREIFSIPQSPSVHPELVEGFFNSF